MKRRMLMIVVGVALAAAGCGDEADSEPGTTTGSTQAEETSNKGPAGIEPVGRLEGPKPEVKPPQGPPPRKLILNDLRKGKGPAAQANDTVTIQFAGIAFDGEPWESSWDDFGKPFRLKLGTEELSPGWEKGIPGMKVGGRREIIIPWNLVYPLGPAPDATPKDGLVYVIDLLDLSSTQ